MHKFKKFWSNYRNLLVRLGVIFSLLLATACGKESVDQKFHLKIAYSPSLCQAPLHLALELGFLEEEGIIGENIQVDAAHVQEAIGAGQVDVGFGLIGKFLQPLENGLQIKFTAGIHTGCIKIFALPNSGITKIADLKGKRIGVPGLAGAEALVAKRALFLNNIKIDPRDSEVEFVVFSRNELGQALQNGIVDAVSLGDPVAAQMVDAYNANLIVDTAKTPEFALEYCCAAFISKLLAEKHPEIAAAFTRAILKASAWVAEHPEEAAKLQIKYKYVAGDADFNAEILKSYNYKPSVKGGYDAIVVSSGQLAKIGILSESTDPEQFAKNSYMFFDDVKDTYSIEESQPPKKVE
ncbi:MAG: ABC transporter substrate-binding protein [Succinivibrionaceae bacterium]|nr:ABC transporter substrate-binding protein [Succinivibrionaceae bacterium]